MRSGWNSFILFIYNFFCKLLIQLNLTRTKRTQWLSVSITAHDWGRHSCLNLGQVKQEAVRLHLKLGEVEDERERLLEEERTRASPAQERERLLQRVKEDNAETASMERQMAELRERHTKLQAELRQAEQVTQQAINY